MTGLKEYCQNLAAGVAITATAGQRVRQLAQMQNQVSPVAAVKTVGVLDPVTNKTDLTKLQVVSNGQLITITNYNSDIPVQPGDNIILDSSGLYRIA